VRVEVAVGVEQPAHVRVGMHADAGSPRVQPAGILLYPCCVIARAICRVGRHAVRLAAAGVRRDALTAQEDLDAVRSQPRLHAFAYQHVRHRVVVALASASWADLWSVCRRVRGLAQRRRKVCTKLARDSDTAPINGSTRARRLRRPRRSVTPPRVGTERGRLGRA